jgi:hypothetical protein
MSFTVGTVMNESELIDEVLELTLACHQGIATPVELARLFGEQRRHFQR